MTLATITLRDKDGQIDFGLVFEGGFDKESAAHQMANTVRQFLDFCARQAEAPQLPGPAAPALLAAPGEATPEQRNEAMQALHDMAEVANRPVSDRMVIVR